MPTIDGDAHVMEGPQTWEYCDPSERKFMPVLVNPGPDADRQFWLVDGKIRGHVRHVIKPKDFHALAQASGRDMVVPPEAQHLEDVPARIRDVGPPAGPPSRGRWPGRAAATWLYRRKPNISKTSLPAFEMLGFRRYNH